MLLYNIRVIRHTFTVLDGIGEKTEKRLWQRGVVSWDDFLVSPNIPLFSTQRAVFYRELLTGLQYELARGNSGVFRDHLRASEHWRLFDEFRRSALCLDIETNGYAPGRGGEVTVVGLYNGDSYEVLVKGENLDVEYLMERLSACKILITFFGASFDIPYLKKSFPGLEIKIPHFDLCHAAKRLRLKGGLKRIEQYFGIERPEAVCGMDGYDAVILWRRWLRGSSTALDLLIKYNREDTVNLFYLAERLYHDLKASTGIYEYCNGS